MKIIIFLIPALLSSCFLDTKHEVKVVLSGEITVNLNVDKLIENKQDIFGFEKKESGDVK